MNAIVFLWSHPRSMSTATERIMRERGDFDCLHEPFMYHYYIGEKPEESRPMLAGRYIIFVFTSDEKQIPIQRHVCHAASNETENAS